MEKLIEFLKNEFPKGIQMFNTRNWVGDIMHNIYSYNGIVIDMCYDYNYIEIFGLTKEQFVQVYNEINRK